MPFEKWEMILAGLSPHAPSDLDDPADVPVALEISKTLDFVPSDKLFALKEEQAGIGIRVRGPLESPVFVAARLAAIALERDIVPIILSEIPRTGLERWGFRVERILGDTEAARSVSIAEIKAFWSIAVVVDAADISNLN